MATQAIQAQGVVLQRGSGGATETFEDVAEVTDFNGPGGSATVIDATHLASSFKEKLMGVADEGQFTFSGNLIPQNDGQKALRADRKARLLRSFKLILTDADATEISFSAYVLSFAITGSVDEKVTFDATLEISGEASYSDAA